MLKMYSYSHSSDEICPSFLSFVSAVKYCFFPPLHLSLQSSLLHEKHCTQKYIKHSEWIGSCRRRRKQKWYSSQKNNRLFWKCHFFQTACFFIIFFLRWMICTQKQCSDFCLQRVTFSSVAHTDMESQRAKN